MTLIADFAVSRAEVVDGTHVRVYFTCPLEASAANRDPAKYTFTGAHALTTVSCDGSGDYIDIQVNEMAPGINYTVHVTNVRDIFERILVNPKSYTFVGNGDSPIVMTATAIDSRTLRVVFSDSMTNGPVLLDPANYTFTGDYDLVNPCDVVAQSITVVSPTTVDIRTSKMVPKSGYFIHVVNVFDWLGNIIIPRLGQKNFPSTFRPITLSALCYPALRKVRLSFDRELVNNAELLDPTNYVFTGPSTFTGILVVYINWHTVDVYYENARNDGTYRVTVYGATDIVGRVPDPWCDEAVLQLVGSGPSLVAVWYRTSIELWAAFDMDMADDAALATPSNYVFVGPGMTAITVTNATLLPSLRTIKLIVTGMADLTPYVLTVSNLTDIHGNALVGHTVSFTSGSYLDPEVDTATALTYTTVEVTFNRAMKDNAALILASNYTFLGATAITAGTVTKVTSMAVNITIVGSMQTGMPYIAAVSNVIDSNDVPLAVGHTTATFTGISPPSGLALIMATGFIRHTAVYEYTSDRTYQWDDTSWVLLTPAHPPVSPPGLGYGRRLAGSAYDSVRRKLVLFGGIGYTGGHMNDTWEWDGSDWAQIVTAHSPSVREGPGMVYDSVNEVVILYGGDVAGVPLNDTWTFDGTDWTQQAPIASPLARYGNSICYDSVNEEVVIYGGQTGTWPFQYLSDTWVYDGSTWTQKAPAHDLGARTVGKSAWDEVNGCVIYFGGRLAIAWDTSVAKDDTWKWTGSDWVQVVTATSPTARSQHMLATYPNHNRVVLVGGYDDSSARLCDTWAFDGTDWTDLSTPVPDILGIADATLHASI